MFLRGVLNKTVKEKIILGVSGGLDSTVTLKLAVEAAGAANVMTGIFPYNMEGLQEAIKVTQWAGIPPNNVYIKDIAPIVDSFGIYDQERKGNIMARVRMIFLFDIAKTMNALVCGTENKTEKELGYFTRYGDAASDIEVINDLYKTDVLGLASELKVPMEVMDRAPSAGLFKGQTDEGDFGFSYQEADTVLMNEDIGVQPMKIDKAIVDKILLRVKNNKFKQEVPYTFLPGGATGSTSVSETESSRSES